jgi:hypothetical protein
VDPVRRALRAVVVGRLQGTITDAGRRGTSKTLAPRTINRHLTICGGIFRRAERKWGIRHNPAAGAEKLSEKGTGRLNFLTPEELAAVVAAAATPEAATLYLVAGMTGLRLGGVAGPALAARGLPHRARRGGAQP